jgi:hypothetical protein
LGVAAGQRPGNGVQEISIGEGKTVQIRTAAFGYGVNNWRRVNLRPDRIDVYTTGKSDQIETSLPLRVTAAAQ